MFAYSTSDHQQGSTISDLCESHHALQQTRTTKGKSIDQYVAELSRILAQSCNFCNCLHDSLISDRIVLGMKDSGAHKRLLQQQQLTLQRHLQDKRRLKHTD